MTLPKCPHIGGLTITSSLSTCGDAVTVAGSAWQLFIHKFSFNSFSHAFQIFLKFLFLVFLLGIFSWYFYSLVGRIHGHETQEYRGLIGVLAAHQESDLLSVHGLFRLLHLNLRENNSLACCGWEEVSHELLLRLPYLNDLWTNQTKGMQSWPTRIINISFADICLVHNWQNRKAVMSIILVGKIVYLLKLDIYECF